MIYIALILILLPVSGLAGGPHIGKDTPGCVIYEDPKGWMKAEGECTFQDYISQDRVLTFEDFQRGPIAMCDGNYQNCIIEEPAAFPCYQRMREAMKAMTFALAHVPAAKGLGEQIWNFVKRPTEVTQMKEWQQVMKDCVEGKP